MAELMGRHLDEMAAIFGGAFAELGYEPPEIAVRGLISASVEAHAVRPELHEVFVEQVPRAGDLKKIARVGGRTEEELAALLRRHPRGVKRGDLGLAAFVILYGAEATIHAAVLERPECVEQGTPAGELAGPVPGYLTFAQPIDP